MRATEDVLKVWRQFDRFPMETITKAWYNRLGSERKQRTVEQMIEHRAQYGTSGNCFDLAMWLIEEFGREKLESYAVLTPHSHVAVVVLNGEGARFLCDLGDQWIEPILIDTEHEQYSRDFVSGFFPGAQVKLTMQSSDRLQVTYKRPNGKTSVQTFILNAITEEELVAAGEKTQRLLRSPLVEMRIFEEDEVRHWEFDNYSSFISSARGRDTEPPLASLEEWAERIEAASGIHRDVVRTALEVYARQGKSGER